MPSDENKIDYQKLAEDAQKLLLDNTDWRETYAGYARDLLKNKDKMAEKRKTFRVYRPLCCYTTIGAIKGSGAFDFDLRYLGQSVGSIKVKNGVPQLTVSESKAGYFKYVVDDKGAEREIKDENWRAGKHVKSFRAHYKNLTGEVPRQQEHMVESALFSELEKKLADTKKLTGIQPITWISGARLHMETALRASDSSGPKLVDPTVSDRGGEVDVFCRMRYKGNRSRLTVIEVKDENKPNETFSVAIKQAIAYAVFIRELARSESGRDWMELWGMGNQPWEKGFTINAVAAMPKKIKGREREENDFSFALTKLKLEGGGATDYIELHYMAFLGNDKPRDGQDVDFETSLKKEAPCQS